MRAAVEAKLGGCATNRRSTSSFIFAVNGSPIFWKSKLQTVVSLSCGGAEYVSLSSCVKEVTWLSRVGYEMVHKRPCIDESATPLNFIEIDSTVAMSITSNKDSTRLTNHIALRFQHVRHHIVIQTIKLQKIGTECQNADSLTKPATSTPLHHFVSAFYLDNIASANN